MTDQAGMRAIGIAVAQLSDNPYPPEALRWGEVSRLRVGPYRIMYTVEGDPITILRVDRSLGLWVCLPEAGQGPPQLPA
jgi:plasmid stabilization system protein ParE